MVSGWLSLLALVVFVAFVKAWFRFPNWENWVCLSGESLEEGHWHVALTATLDHAGGSHLINNMAMMALTATELEKQVGAVRFVAIYFITGAAGWFLTIALTRWRYRGEDWDYAAKYQVSVGSSPATYGLAVCLAVACPSACVGTTGGSMLGVPPFAWISLLLFAPPLASEKYGVQPWPPPRTAKTRNNNVLLKSTTTTSSTTTPLSLPPVEALVDAASTAIATPAASPSDSKTGVPKTSPPSPTTPPPPQTTHSEEVVAASSWVRWVRQMVKCGLYVAAAYSFSVLVLGRLFPTPTHTQCGDGRGQGPKHHTTSGDDGDSGGGGGGEEEEGVCAFTAAQSFLIYNVYVVFLRVVDRCVLGRPFSGGSDHKAHLGGAIAGAMIGLWISTSAAAADADMHSGTDVCGEKGGEWQGSATLQRGILTASSSNQAIVAACLLFLFVRTVTDV